MGKRVGGGEKGRTVHSIPGYRTASLGTVPKSRHYRPAAAVLRGASGGGGGAERWEQRWGTSRLFARLFIWKINSK